jgi:hypothetical protein
MFSLDKYEDSDWKHIHDLINDKGDKGGTGPTSILYTNFKALQQATGADAINNDDESFYDVTSTVAFAQMAKTIGYTNFTLAPYTKTSYWQGVKKDLGSMVDRVYLQVYAGGSPNDPAKWTKDFSFGSTTTSRSARRKRATLRQTTRRRSPRRRPGEDETMAAWCHGVPLKARMSIFLFIILIRVSSGTPTTPSGLPSQSTAVKEVVHIMV